MIPVQQLSGGAKPEGSSKKARSPGRKVNLTQLLPDHSLTSAAKYYGGQSITYTFLLVLLGTQNCDSTFYVMIVVKKR